MSVDIEFDAFQDHQLRAIDAVVDLFTGQQAAVGDLEVELLPMGSGSILHTDLGSGNVLTIADDDILANLMEVQARNGIPKEVSEVSANGLVSRDFTVEMETGTGKTYVFLRTIRELHDRYGLTKFVIVVPRIATREGAMANIRLLRRHFDALYGKTRADEWVYSSGQVEKLRQFGQASHLQVLVINIDAFTKDTNVINQSIDKLSGHRPIDFIRATNPVVILDEPQELESELRRDAIASLNPLVTLRYSATHRNLYNPVYSLSPVDAYDLGLVKRIEVASVRDDPDFNRPSIALEGFSSTKRTVKATLLIDVDRKGSVKRRKVRVDLSSDLFELSGQRSEYEGFTLEGIDAGRGVVEFGNGVTISEGEELGTPKDAVMEAQIRETVLEHLDKELDLARRVEAGEILPTKVLSLFFIDRVANYAPAEGKIRKWFIKAYSEIASRAKYSALGLPPVDNVHGGYFAEERSGAAKDTRGESKADERVYELILRKKEHLLSPDEPLRFLFTHTALGEGWDNPNVFQICTLNELKSEVRKRQQIGRGLRLPVMADGSRCGDEGVNTLVVVANEAYDRFARELQQEIEEETGVSFAGRVRSRRERMSLTAKTDLESDDNFLALWEKIRWAHFLPSDI